MNGLTVLAQMQELFPATDPPVINNSLLQQVLYNLNYMIGLTDGDSRIPAAIDTECATLYASLKTAISNLITTFNADLAAI